MKRGDVFTVADKRGGDYSGKPRPAVIVQSDHFDALHSATICPITSTDADAPLFRVRVEPRETLALDRRSWIEVDKITTVRKARLRDHLGRLAAEEGVALDRALAVFLGIA